MATKRQETERIWMVYGQNRAHPTVKHYEHIGATNEAQRLAAQNPGVPFIVLESVEAYIAPVLSVRCMDFIQGEEVPF